MSRERSRSRSPPDDGALEICWKPVKEDPQNFDAWTHLLQFIEQMDESKPAREAYDDFLYRYPYCYGYWRKYAELERRHKHPERAVEIYERGITAIPLSIDLWLGYLAFYKDYVKDTDAKNSRIRYLYERAISAAGLEFRSDKLWEDYINWELNTMNYPQALGLYDRVLKVPTQMYSSHFDRLQEFVNNNAPDKILPEEEYNDLYEQVNNEIKEKGLDVYVVEEVQNFEENGETDQPAHTEYRKKYNDEALKMFRIGILDKRRKAHLYNEQEVSKRWSYEEGIKRPYFHVKPLERAQLKNWRSYLDFEIDIGIHERVVVLFERCLIACALYEDIWIKYARYMESRKDIDMAREIYKRACSVHLPKKPNPHLAWSAFEEKNENFDGAKEILSDFDRRCEGLLVIKLRRIGLERRRAFKESTAVDTKPDYSNVSSRYERILRDPRTPNRVASFYAVKFARFQAKVRKDKKLAEKILKDALTRDKDNSQLYLQLIDLAYTAEPFDQFAVLDAFDRALHSGELPDSEKVKFSQRKLEFLEDLGTDVAMIQEHFEHHLKLYKSLSGSGSKRKGVDLNRDGDKRMRTSDGVPSGADYSNYYNYYGQQQQPPQGSYQPNYNQQQYGGQYYYPPPY